ncbi:hypothetical protein [Paenibacillus daejeonensis]|uniref:hypothetical protein n=1 Tax=Paenibacillus daejeonensis TaxID=135193 RepID=UPI00035F9FD5|nr:hypothetical protein [Paenibacillus daejeonensis]
MLSDHARKLLRILFNCNRHDSTKMDYLLLLQMSQRDLETIMDALTELQQADYIEWDREAGVARVIYAFEPGPNNWRNKYR